MNLKAQTKNLLFLVCQERLRKLFWFAKNGLGKAKKKTTKQWTVPRERAVYSQSARCSSSPLARGHLQIVLAKTLCCKHPLLSFHAPSNPEKGLRRGELGQSTAVACRCGCFLTLSLSPTTFVEACPWWRGTNLSV